MLHVARSAADAAWVAAWATAILAALAILTAVFAIKAFRKQSKEVSAIQDQVEVQRAQFDEQRAVNAEQVRVMTLQIKDLEESLTERQREADERRRAQAEHVFLSRGDPSSTEIKAYISNASERPIYDVRIQWRDGSNPMGDPDTVGHLMPDRGEHSVQRGPFPGNLAMVAPVAYFRDAAGACWQLTLDGTLDQLSQDQPSP